MKSSASALLRTALTATRHAGRAVTKAAGEGGREGIKNATKELVKEHALRMARTPLFSSVGAAAAAVPVMAGSVLAPQMYGMMAAPMRAQQYPASCECDYYAGAPVSASGRKILTCHSCAPKGMGARDYQRALEAVLPAGPRGRAAPAYLRNFLGPKKRSGSRGRSLTRHSHSRRATRTKSAGRAKSAGHTRSKSK
jgi:hypothetical protein